MARADTVCGTLFRLALAGTALAVLANGQTPEWRRLGNAVVAEGLAGAAGGGVDRVWFNSDGSLLTVRTSSGKLFVTDDFETWKSAPAAAVPEPQSDIESVTRPDVAASLRAPARRSPTVYAFTQSVLWRSEDEGAHWRDVTSFRGTSILGDGFRDLATAPNNPQRIAAGNERGVWLSQDGGITWVGLNDQLPNLPVRRLVAAPQAGRGLRIADATARGLEWLPGQKLGWTPSPDAALGAEQLLRGALTAALGVEITAVLQAGEYVYAGSADGRLWSTTDRGRSWQVFPPAGTLPGVGAVERIWTDATDPRSAVAGLAASSAEVRGPLVLRTVNGGQFWDDLSSNLPAASVYGVTADRTTGAIYVATARGVYTTLNDLRAPVQATPWTAVPGLPDGEVRDVLLDTAGVLLYAAVDGYGVYSTAAPHRPRRPLLLHTADYALRAAAPGALLSLLGAQASTAAAAGLNAPVLAASTSETQIQVPFEAKGSAVEMSFAGQGRRWSFSLPLQPVAPAILVDREGAGMLMDADTGVQLDALNPARPGMRVQLLVTGLGRVVPDWPTGLPAPLDSPPRVAAPVRARLDGQPVEVLRATLAPGYIGFYLVEVLLPELLNSGASELTLEAGGAASNSVRLFVARD